MSPMPNIKHTLAILTNSLDTMYCQQRKMVNLLNSLENQ